MVLKVSHVQSSNTVEEPLCVKTESLDERINLLSNMKRGGTLMTTTTNVQKVPETLIPQDVDGKGFADLNFEVEQKKFQEDQHIQTIAEDVNLIKKCSSVITSCSELIEPGPHKELKNEFEITFETSNKFQLLPIKNECDTEIENERSLQLKEHHKDNDQKSKLVKQFKVYEGDKKLFCDKKTKISSSVLESCLKKFECQNSFQILSDNPEETVQKIIKRNMLKQTPKKSLKKCKNCNFKRRSCVVDISNCKTFNRPCLSCNKPGHNPKSLQCKVRGKGNIVKQTPNENGSEAFSINRDIL